MNKNIIQPLKIIALALVLSVGISYVSAWTAPTATPPGGNTSAPLNVGSGTQTKAGDLILGRNLFFPNNFGLWAKNSGGTDEQWMWPRASDNTMYTNFGANGWKIRNNDSSVVAVEMANTGNVGIGTAPTATNKLEVGGNIKASGSVCNGSGQCVGAATGGVTSVNGQTGAVTINTGGNGFMQWAGTTQSCTNSHRNAYYQTSHSATFNSSGRVTNICTTWTHGACCKSLGAGDYQAVDNAARIYSFGDSGRYNSSPACQSADYGITTAVYLNFHNVPVLYGNGGGWDGGTCSVTGN